MALQVRANHERPAYLFAFKLNQFISLSLSLTLPLSLSFFLVGTSPLGTTLNKKNIEYACKLALAQK